MPRGHYLIYSLLDYPRNLCYTIITKGKGKSQTPEREPNMSIISFDTANLILEAIAYAYVRTDPDAPRAEDTTAEEYETYTEAVMTITKRLFIDFCKDKGIDNVDDGTNEDEEPDFPDDVDESNYDPYSGCDIYEADDMF